MLPCSFNFTRQVCSLQDLDAKPKYHIEIKGVLVSEYKVAIFEPRVNSKGL